MDNPLDDLDEEFDRYYTSFMERGGFKRPCVSEDYELMHRKLDRSVIPGCPHGKTRMTCEQCYIEGQKKGWW